MLLILGLKIGEVLRYEECVLLEQQRVAIVRALAMLLDEVTSALDAELVSEVLDVIRNWPKAG